MRLSIVFAAALLLASGVLAGCVGEPSGEVPTETNADGETIGPSWSFTDTNGTEHSRDSAMGDPSILFFMATWCGSCRQNAPRLAEVHDAFQGKGLDVYSLSWDPTENDDDLERWKSRYDQTWPHGLDPDNRIAKTFGITSQSSFVVLDHQGLVVERFGYPGASESDLRDAVERAYARQEA